MKRVTIKDLAGMLNVSKSTISRALSDHPDISEQTKIRVRKAAEQFNYTTNLHASLFRKNRSGLIALVLPEFNMFFTPGLIDGINETIAKSKKSLIVFLSNNSIAKEQEIIKQCLSWAVEGLLISLSKETTNLEHLLPVSQSEIACVQIDKTLSNNLYPTVTIDNEAASYMAIVHLIKKGHKNILGVFGNPNYSISKDRMSGYRKAMAEFDIPVLNENLISVDNPSDLNFILPPILKHNKTLSAIFTMSDELLAKSHYHINALKIEVPGDLAIISISDGVYPYLCHPRITHIKDSGFNMGERACQLLLEKINGSTDVQVGNLLMETSFVELESV